MTFYGGRFHPDAQRRYNLDRCPPRATAQNSKQSSAISPPGDAGQGPPIPPDLAVRGRRQRPVYPRPGGKLKRMLRGNPAMRKFVRLQWLQKAKVPAPRAVAVLSGFTIDKRQGRRRHLRSHRAGGAARSLSARLRNARPAPRSPPLARQCARSSRRWARRATATMTCTWANLLRTDDGVYLLDAYAVTAGGLKMRQILRLGHSVARYATRQDIKRGWDLLAPARRCPAPTTSVPPSGANPSSRITGRQFLLRQNHQRPNGAASSSSTGSIPTASPPPAGCKLKKRTGSGNGRCFGRRSRAGLLEVLKSSRSGDVLAGEVTLAGRPLEVIVKRARRKKWYRYVNEIGRGSRSWRAWKRPGTCSSAASPPRGRCW